MTHKAVLLVTRILQNRDLLECSGVAKFRLDEEGYVARIDFPAFTTQNGMSVKEHRIRMYEKPDQKHGVIFRFEFHEGSRPYFTVEDYLRKGTEQVLFLKKSEALQQPKMDQMISTLSEVVQQTIDSVPKLGRYLAGAD